MPKALYTFSAWVKASLSILASWCIWKSKCSSSLLNEVTCTKPYRRSWQHIQRLGVLNIKDSAGFLSENILFMLTVKELLPHECHLNLLAFVLWPERWVISHQMFLVLTWYDTLRWELLDLCHKPTNFSLVFLVALIRSGNKILLKMPRNKEI